MEDHSEREPPASVTTFHAGSLPPVRTRAAVCFRKSTAGPSDTLKVFVKTAGSARTPDSSPLRQRGVNLVVDGENMGEVDWVAESPSSERLYRTVAHERIEDVIAGGRASFVACGQAGSGKSSTLFFHETSEGARAGMLPRIAMHLFAELPASCKVSTSFVELYNDQIFDLLARGAPVRLKESPSHAAERDGGTRVAVRTATELIELVRSAEMGRHTSVRPRMQPSLARAHRGHALLTVFVGSDDSPSCFSMSPTAAHNGDESFERACEMSSPGQHTSTLSATGALFDVSVHRGGACSGTGGAAGFHFSSEAAAVRRVVYTAPQQAALVSMAALAGLCFTEVVAHQEHGVARGLRRVGRWVAEVRSPMSASA